MEKEGLSGRGCLAGDPMYDAFIKYSRKKAPGEIKLKMLDGDTVNVPEEYYYLTCHREENTKDDRDLTEIFTAMERLDAPTVYPVHPRNKQRALRLRKEQNLQNLLLTEPVGYLESICLVNHAKKIVTDSGGLQREAFFAGKKCVTILDFVCWPETMVGNRNVLSAPKAEEILKKLAKEQVIEEEYQPFGDGHAGEKIVECMMQYPKNIRL